MYSLSNFSCHHDCQILSVSLFIFSRPLPQKSLSASSSFLGHILTQPFGQQHQHAVVPRLKGQSRQYSTQPRVTAESAGVAEDAPVVVVTGASRGIGKAIALHFGAKGAKVRRLPASCEAACVIGGILPRHRWSCERNAVDRLIL